MVKISKACFKHKIKQGDNVMIISGKDRGKTGLIERVFVKSDKVLVPGVAISKRHLKPSRKNPHGGIIDMPSPIASSNVMILCPHCGKAVRIAHRVSATMKERICRKCQGNLDTKTEVKAKTKDVTVKVKSPVTSATKEKNAKS
jgi:large subunit ribosomal protein L24